MNEIKGVVSGNEVDISKVAMIVNGVDKGWEVRTQNGDILWGADRTLTGTSSISMKGYGLPLKSVHIKGNSSQTGTPTPDAPIQPDFCGVRTRNLCPNIGWRSGQYRDGVWETTNTRSTSDFFPVSSNQYRLKINAGQLISFINFNYFDNQKQWLGNRMTLGMSTFSPTAQNIVIPQLPSNTAYMCITIRFYNDNGNPPIPQSFIDDSNIMVSEGTSEPSYEPYGYKIPITCAGQTVPVYLGQTQTVRRIKKVVLTGKERDWVNAAAITDTNAYQNVTVIAGYKREAFYCSHMVATTSGESTTTHGYIGQRLTLCMDKTLGLDTVDKFKAYLAAQYANGTPVTVWYVLAEPETAIVNEPLAKIGDYADELNGEDAGVTIPTVKGSNTLTVETDLQPSEMTITGHIKQMQFVYVTDSDGVYCFDSDGVQIIEEV